MCLVARSSLLNFYHYAADDLVTFGPVVKSMRLSYEFRKTLI